MQRQDFELRYIFLNFCSYANALDLLLTNARELIGDIRIGSCLGYSDHGMVDFTHLRGVGQTKCKIRKLSSRKADFIFQ